MLLPNGAMIAVADGEKLNLFHNKGHEDSPELTAVPVGKIASDNHGSGARHHASAANHDHGQLEEDSHSAGVAALLNAEVTAGRINKLVVIASPKALGELRKHYSKELEAALLGEIAKDLTGHSVADVQKAIEAA